MKLQAAVHGVGIALDALRGNRVRALLTTGGVVVGVATVMAMAAVIAGVRGVVTEELAVLGPDQFVVERYDATQLRLADLGEGRPPWAGTPAITLREAAMLRGLASIQSATPNVNGTATLRHGRTTAAGLDVEGAGADWPDYRGGGFLWGRNFTASEVERSAPVVVFSEALARDVFGGSAPAEAEVRLDGIVFRVVGVYRARANVLATEPERWMVAPYTTAIKHLSADEAWLDVRVIPHFAATREQAMNDVTAALRRARGLHPAQPNNFAISRQETVQALFDDTTQMFFGVMLLLSSLGLLVGGVGVMAMMSISVSERMREIGVRKALGATRRDILWQFLVETVTITAAGGAAGIALAGAGAVLVAHFTPVPAAVPLWSVAAGLGVSAVCGLLFGILPAARAARLDPVVALARR